MEDFLGVIVLIIYLFVAASGKKRNKKQKKQPRPKRRQKDFEQAFDEIERRIEAMTQTVQPVSGNPDHQDEVKVQHAATCERQRLHLHEVTQAQLQRSGEGEDSCHAGGAVQPEAEQADHPEEDDAARRAIAQDVLRGVIMSEILTRPCGRMATKRSKRSIP